MRGCAFLLTAFLASTALRAEAAEGFVVESEGANLDTGAAVEADTAVSVAAGGHLALLTAAGQMVIRRGPFEGTGAEAIAALDPAIPAAPSGALAALVDLATEKGAAQNRVFASRNFFNTPPPGPFAITEQTTVYCARADVAPLFVLRSPPSIDLLIELTPTAPKAPASDASWLAGLDSFPWPKDWPAARTGSYEWSAGITGGAFELHVYQAMAGRDDMLASAAELLREGCDDQAWAALQQAVAAAKNLQ